MNGGTKKRTLERREESIMQKSQERKRQPQIMRKSEND